MKIAFLGLGNMGSHIARNLVDAGYDVNGFDVVDTETQAAAEHGVIPAETAEEAVIAADVVITMFPAGIHALEAYSTGLFAAALPGRFATASTTLTDY